MDVSFSKSCASEVWLLLSVVKSYLDALLISESVWELEFLGISKGGGVTLLFLFYLCEELEIDEGADCCLSF